MNFLQLFLAFVLSNGRRFPLVNKYLKPTRTELIKKHTLNGCNFGQLVITFVWFACFSLRSLSLSLDLSDLSLLTSLATSTEARAWAARISRFSLKPKQVKLCLQRPAAMLLQ